jgi:mannosyltransferase OCH1-like enzyme
MKTPRIIHQIWCGERNLPSHLEIFSQTWINKHPDWKYEFWNDERISYFIEQYYPQYSFIFKSFPYDIQRWDAIRYLILYKYGGMYVDFDTECLEPLEPLLKDKECWFALEPEEHRKRINRTVYLSNAIFGSIPKHTIIKKIIERVFNELSINEQIENICKTDVVMNTTGPYMLIDFYENLSPEEKNTIYLIPAIYLSPLSAADRKYLLSKKITESDELYFEEKLRYAYAVHYFFTDWL